jgi:N-acetylneuraminate synthase
MRNEILSPGKQLEEDDIYLAIPLQKGQISTRELMLGKFGHKITEACKADSPILIDMLDTPYGSNESLRTLIYNRGL